MLIIKETGTIYNEINRQIVEFETGRGLTLAWCDDPIYYNHGELSYDPETGGTMGNNSTAGWSREITLEEENEAIRRIRGLYYAAEADPYFMQLQEEKDGFTRAGWIDKKNEIRDRFPYRE